jgi:hypothetical protein
MNELSQSFDLIYLQLFLFTLIPQGGCENKGLRQVYVSECSLSRDTISIEFEAASQFAGYPLKRKGQPLEFAQDR